jgi:hypothetical protein
MKRHLVLDRQPDLLLDANGRVTATLEIEHVTATPSMDLLFEARG